MQGVLLLQVVQVRAIDFPGIKEASAAQEIFLSHLIRHVKCDLAMAGVALPLCRVCVPIEELVQGRPSLKTRAGSIWEAPSFLRPSGMSHDNCGPSDPRPARG